MEETGFFKTAAFGGFDKKSVLNYIDSLNENFRKLELDYQNKLEEFSKAQDSQLAHIKKLEAQLEEQNQKLVVVAEELEKERLLTKEAKEASNGQDEQVAELQKKLNDQERELQIQLERNRQLQFKAESLDYKSKKYDEFSSQIGDTIIEAKRNAEQIIADANDEASRIANQAQDYLKNFYSELSSFSGDAARLRKSIEEILFVLNDRIDVMQEVIRQVEKRFDPAGTQLHFVEEADPFSQPDDSAGYFGSDSAQSGEAPQEQPN